MSGNIWTGEQTAVLEKMWAENRTHTDIAAALGNGITVSGVSNKLYRLGLANRRAKPTQATIWTDAMNQMLRLRWSEKVSCRAIGNELGVTKSAIIGRARRLGLARRSSGGMGDDGIRVPREPATRRTPFRQPPPASHPIFDAITDLSPTAGDALALHVSLLDLTSDQCRWPFGEGRDTTFCGQPRVDGYPYCQCHAARAYQPGARSLKNFRPFDASVRAVPKVLTEEQPLNFGEAA